MKIKTAAKHTPGPWNTGAIEEGRLIFDWHGVEVAAVNKNFNERNKIEALANRRLIASAPIMIDELLAQLEFMDKHVATVVVDHWAFIRRRNALCAAIAKASVP